MRHYREQKELKELTSRQKWLYNYIVDNTLLTLFSSDTYVTAEQIIKDYNFYMNGTIDYEPYIYKDKSHDKCIALRNDIDRLNIDFSKEHIIYIKGDYSYKIATSKAEVKEMLERIYYQVAYNKLRKASVIIAKMRRNNNMQVLDNDNLSAVEDEVERFVRVFDSENDEISEIEAQ